MGEELQLWQFLAVQFPLGVLLVIYTLSLAKIWGSHEEYLYNQISERVKALEHSVDNLSNLIRGRYTSIRDRDNQ